MDQPAQSPDCNPIEYLWDELRRGINDMDHLPHNLHELRQALLDQSAYIPVERLQRLWPLLLTWFNFNPSMDK